MHINTSNNQSGPTKARYLKLVLIVVFMLPVLPANGHDGLKMATVDMRTCSRTTITPKLPKIRITSSLLGSRKRTTSAWPDSEKSMRKIMNIRSILPAPFSHSTKDHHHETQSKNPPMPIPDPTYSQ